MGGGGFGFRPMSNSTEQPLPAAPRTAAAAIVAFGREFAAALFLRPTLYAATVSDAGSWRRAGVVVILAALAADSMGLYSRVDEFLVVILANWSLIPIMLLALARWAVASGAAWAACRILGKRVTWGDLLRPAGFAHAPAALQFLPALLYWLELTQVTSAMRWTVRLLAVPWMLAALTLAAVAAGVSPLPRAIVVAVVLFIAGNLFDLLLDDTLLFLLGLSDAQRSLQEGVG